MDSRIRTNYQWKIFLPMAIVLWITLFAMGIFVYRHNSQFKYERTQDQLKMINDQIITLYNEGAPDSEINRYFNFITSYYRDIAEYHDIRISAYDNGEIRYVAGAPIPLSSNVFAQNSGLSQRMGNSAAFGITNDNVNKNDFFFYRANTSDDGKFIVITLLPDSQVINRQVTSSYTVMIALFVVAIILTVITYLSARRVGRNIRLLRSVAERAAQDPNFIPTVDFPHDELGDINRQIMHIFNERAQAMKRQKQEHTVALHAIEDKARSKRQMSSNINHELRTPVSVIKGYLDTIIENPDMDQTTERNFIKKAQQHANRLTALLNDVSAITRLEDGSELISTEPTDFHDLAFTLASDIEDSGVLGDMVFNFDIPLNCKVMGNFSLLSGMIMNLARNAATHSKGQECELICAGEDDNFYTFIFRDNGIGVGEEHIPHLFDRFYRVDTGRSRKVGGTGLGLPIVQSTVVALGGKIKVENGKTGGLSFTFTLPKAPQE